MNILIVLIWIVCGLITHLIGKEKNRHGFLWGFLLGLIGVVIMALLPAKDAQGDDGAYRRAVSRRTYKAPTSCPHCGSRKITEYDATCPDCHESLAPTNQSRESLSAQYGATCPNCGAGNPRMATNCKQCGAYL